MTFAAPVQLKTLEKDAFRSCHFLASATLNEGLEEVGEGCFRMAGLEEVTLPKSVKTIGRRAFCGCEKLGTF